MNSNEDQIYSENSNENNENSDSKDLTLKNKPEELEDNYRFGWSNYSEITNGRFAMIGFLAIIIIELLSKQSFLNWAGIL